MQKQKQGLQTQIKNRDPKLKLRKALLTYSVSALGREKKQTRIFSGKIQTLRRININSRTSDRVQSGNFRTHQWLWSDNEKKKKWKIWETRFYLLCCNFGWWIESTVEIWREGFADQINAFVLVLSDRVMSLHIFGSVD